MYLSKSKSEVLSRSRSRPPRMRRLSLISSFSTDAPILQSKDEIQRRRNSWVLPGRLEDTSHFIAESRWGILFERAIMPVTCGSIESWSLYMLVFALVLTVPFGVHRWLYGWWEHRFFLLQLANFLLETVGLSPLFGGVTVYNYYPTEKQSPGTDLAFAMHIVAGITWLLCGFLLFFTVNKISKRSHRRLAYVSGFFLFLHLAAASYNLYVNTVKHPHLTRMILFEEIVVVSALIAGGVLAARKKDFQRHQDIMVRAFIHSVDGAGTIRFVSMVIWMSGRFFTPEAAAYFDAGECFNQSASSPMGINVRGCQGPYLLRFHMLRMVTFYHWALYLKLPEKVRDTAARAALREEIKSNATWTLVLMTLLAASYQLDHDMSSWQPYLNMVPQEVWIVVAVSMALKDSYDRYKFPLRMLKMPRRCALIPGRTSLLMAAREASRLVLDEISLEDSDLDPDSDSEVSDGKEKAE